MKSIVIKKYYNHYIIDDSISLKEKITGYEDFFPWYFRRSSSLCSWKVFCSFNTAQKFCHSCNVSKDELKEHPRKKNWLLQSKDSYNYSIEQLQGDSRIASAYEIKKSLCLNDLSYFYVTEGLRPDIAHDMFED